MSSILWLAYERPPHPDSVRVAAGETDLRFVLAVLSLPYRDRHWYATQFETICDCATGSSATPKIL